MKKVFVGMSGGVDSSVSAALLKDQGYDVTGVYMKNWSRDVAGHRCPWREDLADAQSVAARLDIPFRTFDFEDEYRQKVVEYMVAEYRAGRTPNPDIMCNQEVKFKLFLETALEEGADMIATGHYAKTVDGKLFAGSDKNKDQSYFLYRVTYEALEQTLFPLGDLNKDEVRQKAAELNLPTAKKPDSQGICFIGEVSIKEFLSEYVDTESGPIKHVKTGEVLGEHEGAIFYTIGQRHGLDIGGTVHVKDKGGGLPLYVISKDMETNTVYVTEQLDALRGDTFTMYQLHWIDEPPETGGVYRVRTRHRGRLIPGKLKFSGDKEATVVLDEPERALSPGQSAVIYEEDGHELRVIGGGVIAF